MNQIHCIYWRKIHFNTIFRTLQHRVNPRQVCQYSEKSFNKFSLNCLIKNKILQPKQCLFQPINFIRNVPKARLLPFEVESKHSEDILIFSSDKQRFFQLFGLFGIVMLIFWGNLAMFVYYTAPILSKRTVINNDNSWSAMIINFQAKYANIAAGICLSFAAVFALLTCLYPLRAIHKLILLRGGNSVQLTTYAPFGLTRQLIVPVNNISCLHARESKYVNLVMKIKPYWFYFLMDKRDGKFHRTDLFDFVVGLQR